MSRPDLYLLALLEAKEILTHDEAEALIDIHAHFAQPVNYDTAENFIMANFEEATNDMAIQRTLEAEAPATPPCECEDCMCKTVQPDDEPCCDICGGPLDDEDDDDDESHVPSSPPMWFIDAFYEWHQITSGS